jgi:exonuclease VII small subunit
MKKILTFAMMALLLGCFSFNASAQKALKLPSNNKSTKFTLKETQTKGNDVEKTLKDYEAAVEHCLTIYHALNTKDTSVKASAKEFDKALNQAESLRDKIEKAKDGLNRTQTSRFNAATKKLSQVYQK